MTEVEEPGVITGNIELLEMYLLNRSATVRDEQQRSLFKPCRLGKLTGCLLCKIKRWVLRRRYR